MLEKKEQSQVNSVFILESDELGGTFPWQFYVFDFGNVSTLSSVFR